MNLDALLESTQKKFVSNPLLSTSKEIVYTHLDDNSVETIRAFSSSIKYNSLDSDSISIKRKFANVVLTTAPKIDDTILEDGVLYSVDQDGWIFQHGMYEITASKSRHRR